MVKSSLLEQTLDDSEHGNKPIIVLGKQLDKEVDAILTVLYTSNEPTPEIYVRGRELVRVCIDKKHRPSIEVFTTETLISRICDTADFFRYSENNGTRTLCHPPDRLARQVLSRKSWDFPELSGITEVPIVRQDGTILDVPGYDTMSHLLYLPQAGFELPTIPEFPTPAQVSVARDFAFDFISEFPYVTDADRANAYGLMLTVVTRGITGLVPLALLNAKKMGTGKGLLFKVIAWLLTGRTVGMSTMPISEEEWGKMLTGLLLSGDTATYCLDNVDSPIKSGKFAAFLTTEIWKERQLGSNNMPELENRTIGMATGNNIQLGGDIPRRCYRIAMDAGISKPEERTNFRYEPLMEHIKANRGKIIAALLTLVRAWFVAGQPEPNVKVSFQDDYAGWAKIISGVLAFADIHGFLGNKRELYEDADVEGEQWLGFLKKWDELFSTQEFSVSDLKKELDAEPIFKESLPDDLKLLCEKEDKGFSTKLGLALRKRDGVPFGEQNYKLVHTSNSRSARTKWCVSMVPLVSLVSFPGSFTNYNNDISNKEDSNLSFPDERKKDTKDTKGTTFAGNVPTHAEMETLIADLKLEEASYDESISADLELAVDRLDKQNGYHPQSEYAKHTMALLNGKE